MTLTAVGGSLSAVGGVLAGTAEPPAFLDVEMALRDPAGTSLTVSVPAVPDGSMLVAFVAKRNTDTVTAPAGWTPVAASGTATHVSAFSRVKEAGDTSATFTWGTSSKAVGAIHAASGVGSVSDFGTATPSGTAATVITPSLTPGGPALLLVGAVGTSGTWTPDEAMTERVDTQSSATSAVSMLVADEVVAAGATGTRTSTLSTAVANTNRAGLAVLLAPLA